MKTIAVDFDHTLCSHTPEPGHKLGPPIEGAREALMLLKNSGYNIIIYSCNRPEVIANWMAYFNVPYSTVWQHPKPKADWYIDDKNLRFTTWGDVLGQIL